jgi:hypothetical protein
MSKTLTVSALWAARRGCFGLSGAPGESVYTWHVRVSVGFADVELLCGSWIKEVIRTSGRWG